MKVTNELRKGLGTVSLTTSSLLLIFLVANSLADDSINITDSVMYTDWILTAFFFMSGCAWLNSIKDCSSKRIDGIVDVNVVGTKRDSETNAKCKYNRRKSKSNK